MARCRGGYFRLTGAFRERMRASTCSSDTLLFAGEWRHRRRQARYVEAIFINGSMRPVLLAALNCDPAEGSARLAGAVIRETLARGGQACRPLIAAKGLGPALVDPALSYIEQRGGDGAFR